MSTREMAKAVAVLFAVVMLVSFSLAWKYPIADRDAPLPMKGLSADGSGYCVALYDGDTLLGIETVGDHGLYKVDPGKRDEFAISTYNAVAHIALRAGRPDLADKAVSLRHVKPGTIVPEGTMVCSCTNTIWCKQGPGKIGICGCGGACGSCESCFVSPKIQ